MRRTVVLAWAMCVLGCDPEEVVVTDAASLDVPATEQDAPVGELDAPGLDGATGDTGLSDAPLDASPDASAADAGEFDGHIIRLANMRGTTALDVELCIYPDGIESEPTRMMEALGRSGGLAQFEVSARYAFTASRGSVPVRVIDLAGSGCDTPIYETAITSARSRVLFVLAGLSFTGANDEIPAPGAADIWRHVHHAGNGVIALVHPDGSEQRPTPMWADASVSGTLEFRNFDGDVLFSRALTVLPGGAFSTYTHSASLTEVEVVICDDRAPGMDGLTPCGATVRP